MRVPDYTIGVVIVALIIVAVIVSVIKGKRAAAEIAAICLRRGWTNRPGVLGFGTVSGHEMHVPWSIELQSSTNDESRQDSSHATIKFKLNLPAGEAYMAPAQIHQILTTKTTGMIMSAVAKRLPPPGVIGKLVLAPTYPISGLSDFVGTGDKAILNRIVNAHSATNIRAFPEDAHLTMSVVNGEVMITLAKYNAEKFARDLEQLHSLAVALIRAGRS